MIVGAKGFPGEGKTAALLLTMLELWRRGWYTPADTIGNVTVNAEGYTKLSNDELKQYILWLIKGEQRHKIIIADEADKIWPGRSFKDREQSEALVNLWQDQKMQLWFLYSAHKGKGVDAILRAETNILLLPRYDKASDTMDVRVLNGMRMQKFTRRVDRVSRLWVGEFPLYDRWELVS